MKKLFCLIGTLVILIPFALIAQDFTYIGAGKCKICHKTEKQGKQHPIWEESKHSKAFQTLSTPAAAEQAKEKGLTNAAESAECLKCHAPLFEKAAELNAEGVTCEACHGPGSAYNKLSIMKSREESVNNGLIAYDSDDAIKKQCLTCHDAEKFDFNAAWEKIKHPVPEKS
ncbi:multiheme c-type cytochrome [Acidobacteriota bacterium]